MIDLTKVRLREFCKKIGTFSFIALFVFSCSSDSGGGGASLDGDLRYMVEGSEGESVYLSYNAYSETELSFETIGQVAISSSGTVEGDLEDGDYSGYQLMASGTGADTPDITLKLLSDGEVLGESSEVNSEGMFMVEVGDIPNYNE